MERPRRYRAEEYDQMPAHARREPPHFDDTDLVEEDMHRRKWLIAALGIGAVVILSSVALSLLFAGATITVHPLESRVVADATFTASSEESPGALAFERVVVERTKSKTVVALGEEKVEERTTGKITVYNEYSEAPQRLIPRTRFVSSAGRTYRVAHSVEVPGKRVDGTPGSIEIQITAEEAGEDYNITGPDTFTLPGLEGFPQEDLVYARSMEDLAGGFVGVKRSVGETERQTALDTLEAELRDELQAAAFSDAEKPDGYYLFKDATFYEFNTLPDELVETDKVTVSLSGKLHGILLKEDMFAQLLAQQTLGSYNGAALYIKDPDELIVKVKPQVPEDTDESQAPWEAHAYDVSVDGTAHFIWEFDADRFAHDLAGKDKVILEMPSEGGILEAYPGIDRATANVRPFWKKTFPESPEDIMVVTELDE